MSKEIWKDAKYNGYDISLYQVSNLGNVRNKETKHVKKKNSRGNDKGGKYHFVELRYSKAGERKSKDFKVSRLVAFVFCGNPENKPYVDHINRNGFDDHAENLRWVTPRENAANQGPNRGRELKGVYEQKPQKRQCEFEFMNPAKYIATCGGEHIGTFNTKEEAAMAYNERAKEMWGEYAALNYED